MRQNLMLHPSSICPPVTRIDVDVARPSRDFLVLTYVVSGKIDELLLLPKTAPARTDNLWHHTCFEAFIRTESAAGYLEFNLSPSTQWAAYTFTAYREGMANAEVAPPVIEIHHTPDAYTLTATLRFDQPAPPWRIALTTVVEETNARKSYWSLAHPPGKPEFHHADGFVLELK